MANSNTPFGLRPIRHNSGEPYNGSANRYFVPASDSTALYIGDPVIIAGSADADGVATVTKATAAGGAYMLGPVVSVEQVTRDSTTYREASTARYVWVADDPDLVFLVQEDGVGGALAVTDVGLNADWVAGSGSTVTGLSGMMLDTSTKATTATLQLRIQGFNQSVDNEVGSANAKVLVTINLHSRRNATGI